MAKSMVHVRFKLTELVRAVRILQQAPQDLMPADALSVYWNWARDRGWRLVAHAKQMDPHNLRASLESSGQVEITTEEFWDVTFEGESMDMPDLVGAMGVAQRMTPTLYDRVLIDLENRGWVRDQQATEMTLFEQDECVARILLKAIKDRVGAYASNDRFDDGLVENLAEELEESYGE